MRVVFIGPPGAGKGTQAARIEEYLSISHLSTGDMLREAITNDTETGRLAKQYIDKGELVTDKVVIKAVIDRLRQPECAPGVLFDGFPRTLAQAEALDEHLAIQGMAIDAVIELVVEDEIIVQRLAGRGRPDDQHEIIQQRLRVFRNQTAPLLDYYRHQNKLISIDGIGTPDEVTARIKIAIEKKTA